MVIVQCGESQELKMLKFKNTMKQKYHKGQVY